MVVFLHGWGATQPRSYRPWLDHLARQGNAVIYPRYQDSLSSRPRRRWATCSRAAPGAQQPGA